MFDFFDPSKLIVVGIIALIFIGPKELPRVLRQVGQVVGKMRRMAAEFQGQFMDAMKEADVGDLKQDFAKLNETATKSFSFNPINDIKNDLANAVSGAATPASAAPVELAVPELPMMAPPDLSALAPSGNGLDAASESEPARRRLKYAPARKPVARPRRYGPPPRANGQASQSPEDTRDPQKIREPDDRQS